MRAGTPPPPPPMAPQGASFVYDQAVKSLTDQMSWIDALDSKAGILLAADGVIAGVVLTRESILMNAPRWLAIIVALLILTSLALALGAFATRHYEIAPDAAALVPLMRNQDELGLKWASLPNVLDALEVNEPKVARKANYLFYSGLSLLLGGLTFGGYFVYEVATKA